MRNYIILNGQNSNSIQGLLIQFLAPISKPQMRTQIEEIDGRNGDIVEELGFASYDKQITIGLFGNFNVDDVIAYFNSKGTVIFSNEPDKYYNYQITDQIDFERLVRFKTATVTMHCQPFKYSTTEGAESLTPSDNLLSIPDTTKTSNGVTVTSANGVISVQGTPTASTEIYLPIESLMLQAGSYTLDATANGQNPSNCSMRLIGSAPSNADSFGGKFITLADGTVSLQATLSASKTFGFLWFYINAGKALNFKLTVEVEDDATKTASGEGSAIVLDGTGEALFNKLDPKGNANQQTYSGKNLLRIAPTSGSTSGGLTWVITENTITISGTATSTSSNAPYFTLPTPLEAGTYRLTLPESLPFRVSLQMLEADSSAHGGFTAIQAGQTTTADTSTWTTARLRLAFAGWTAGDTINFSFPNRVMFSAGSEVEPYEPYVGGVPSPNPDYPQDVNVVSGEQTVKITGKNLAYLGTGTTAYSGVQVAIDNGTITLNGTATVNITNIYSPDGYLTLRAGQTYTLSANNPDPMSGAYVRIRQTDGSIFAPSSKQLTEANAHIIFTPTEDIYGAPQVRLGSGSVFNNFILKPQLELGSATAYEPYQGQTQTISLGSIELAKIGNYEDKLVKVDDTWYIRRAVGKAIVNDTDGTTYTTDLSHANDESMLFYTVGFTRDADISGGNQQTRDKTWSNYFTPRNIYATSNTMDGYYIANNSNRTLAIRLRREHLATEDVAGFKAWLSEHTPIFYYGLAEPVDEEITDATLIEQLDALEQAHSYKNRTHITAIATGNNAPHIIEVEASKSTDGSIVNSGNIYSKPKLTIFGSGEIGVYLNGLQIFQIALGDEGYITIDTDAMEAYKDTTENLKNRLVTGDYENFALQVGENQITFSGSVTKCIVENYSRWL